VTGIELETTAVKAAEVNAEINDIKNVSFKGGSVQDILRETPDYLSGVTATVIDPPRAGMHAKALKGLLRMEIPRLVYISCNPATFARDAARLVDSGYRLGRVTPVDMFPHTMHIELVAGFEKG
jgi:23S rRNA (uracil1939-C5)-methyltransferase